MLSGDSYLRRAQQLIFPEITAAQFINNGSRFNLLAFRHGNGFVPIMVERRAHTFKRKNAECLQQRKKFLMEVAHAYHQGLLSVAGPLQRFLHIVDDV